MLPDRRVSRTSRRTSAVAATAALIAVSLSPASLMAADKKKAEAATQNVPSYYGAQPAAEALDLTMYNRIRNEGFAHGKVMQLAEALNDGIGPRLTGSPNMAKANAWTRDTLTAMGLSNAHLEDWGDFGMGWQQINTWARMVGPDPEPLWLQAAPWSPATSGPVTGQVVYVPLTDGADLDKLKGTLGGKIVLLGSMRPTPDLTEPLFHRYTEEQLKEMEIYALPGERRPGAPAQTQTREQLMAERMRQAQLKERAEKMMASEGVSAIITPSRDGGEGGGTGIIFDDNGANLARGAQDPAKKVTIPNAVMMIEHYNRLARMVSAHVPVTVEVNIDTKFTGDHEHGFDTIAEIPGTDPTLKEQVVMVGGHLDSWISGTGATDNGAGSVMAMEAMRILKTLNVQPRRTIRIALWSGEEEGLYGSQGYVKHHFGAIARTDEDQAQPQPPYVNRGHGALTTTPEWEKLDAYYNLDNGTGKVRGVYLQENLAVGPIFRQWIAPLADLGVTAISPRNTGGTDHLSFDAVGLAGFQYIQDPMDYETRTHHSDMDTVDRLHGGDLEQGAVVEAIFAQATAASRARRRPHRTAQQHLPNAVAPSQPTSTAAPAPSATAPNTPAPDAGKPNASPATRTSRRPS